MPRLTGSAATPHAAMAWGAAGIVPHATSAIPQAAHTAAPPIGHHGSNAMFLTFRDRYDAALRVPFPL